MKIGFIDYYLDEWHANNYPARIRELSGGEMEVMYAYAEIDSPLGGMTTDEWCAHNGVQRVSSIEELVELSDGIIILSPDNCERHEDLCRIPLASGKPCYVDKTFAPSGEIAQRIFAVAEAAGTPCYSTSALRYAEEYRDIDPANIVAIASAGPAYGPGVGYETYAIHQLEPVIMLMNARPAAVLAQQVGTDWYTMLIKFADGRMATLTGSKHDPDFRMTVCTTAGSREVRVASDFFGGFLAGLVGFFRTRISPVAHQSTVDIMALREAGIRALENPGEWIHL